MAEIWVGAEMCMCVCKDSIERSVGRASEVFNVRHILLTLDDHR